MEKIKLRDRICNRFYVWRYKFYTKYRKSKLKNWSPSVKEGLELVFEDDFNEVSWSRKQVDTWRKWGIGEHWGWFHPNNARSWWTEPVFNGDGTISCQTRVEPKLFHRKEEGGYWYADPVNFEPVESLTLKYSVGGLSTGHRNADDTGVLFKQQYGRWECRCRVPAVKGVRSAYWMWGSTWPPEIDVFEIDGREDHSDQKINLHFGKTSDGTKDSIGSTLGAKRLDGEWQEFVLEWSPGKMEMYTDGIKIFQTTDDSILKWFDDPVAQMWVLVYQAVISDEVGDPDENGIISSFDVDYVRVYKR